MAAQVHALTHDDVHEHPAKKLRTVDGSCRRSNLGVRVTSALQVVPTDNVGRDAPEPAPCTVASTAPAEASTSCPPAADPGPPPIDLFPGPAPEGSGALPIAAPLLFRRPQLEQPELAGSLDGWLKHNGQLPALKKLRRDSTCSMQSLDAWMDTGGYTSPAPGSPQWFRLQPSPARQPMRSSPSIDIQVLSPVFPEQYPEDMDTMSDGDPDDDFCLSPSHAAAAATSPPPDRTMASPATTPRRRAPSRLGWRSPRPQSADGDAADDPSLQPPPPGGSGCDDDGEEGAAPRPRPDGEPGADGAGQEGEGGAGGAGCSAGGGGPGASSSSHDAAEVRAVEYRLLQMLHTGNGMVLVADALRLFRGYMEDEADKDAVRTMLKRWCVLVEHPVGSGCRWLYLRSAAEAAGATIPDA